MIAKRGARNKKKKAARPKATKAKTKKKGVGSGNNQTPRPLTPRQEKAALSYMECGDKTKAYREAGYSTNMKPESIHRNAFKVFENIKVIARLNELRAIQQERHNVTVDSLTVELDEARDVARSEDQAAPMVSATMGKAKLHGLITDKKEHGGPRGGPIPFVEITPDMDPKEASRLYKELMAGG